MLLLLVTRARMVHLPDRDQSEVQYEEHFVEPNVALFHSDLF